MSPQTWSVLAAAAAALSIAGPVAMWVVFGRRLASLERWLGGHVRARRRETQDLEERLARMEETLKVHAGSGAGLSARASQPRRSPPLWPTASTVVGRSSAADRGGEDHALIAVPLFAPAPVAADREAAADEISQRYAEIWELAQSGSTADAIARATGQPVGQIELILGLRRQIDGHRNNTPHESPP